MRWTPSHVLRAQIWEKFESTFGVSDVSTV